MTKKQITQLSDLMNVGKATLRYLSLLNIHTIEQLAATTPDELYTKLEAITQKHYDPCLWDLFAAIINEARTNQKTPWWDWTPIRKKKEIKKPLCGHRKLTK